MEQNQDLKITLSYIHSELNRIETMAGTLSAIEQEHYKKLTNFEHRELLDMAVEEQNAARQLATMKMMCLALAQNVDGIRNAIEKGTFGERIRHVETH